jgi:hypothetical protein
MDRAASRQVTAETATGDGARDDEPRDDR